jgi:class 3 adenylate cyclase
MSDEQSPSQTTPSSVTRKLAAILAADVQGYSRLIEKDEVGTLRVLTPSLHW